MKHLISALAILLSLMSCGQDRHSGVFTETETGQKIAGILVDSSGNPLQSARIVVKSNSLHGTNTRTYETTTDSLGNFILTTLDSFNLTIFFLSTDSLWAGRIELQSLTSDTTLLDTLPIQRASAMSIEISSWNLQLGDSICTDASWDCQVVHESDVQSGQLHFPAIAHGIYQHVYRFTASHLDTLQVSWDLLPGTPYLSNAPSQIQAPLAQISWNPNRSLNLQGLVADHMTFPIILNRDLSLFSLVDSRGYPILIDTIIPQGQSFLYWLNATQLDLRSDTPFRIFCFHSNPSISEIVNDSPLRHIVHFESSSDSGIVGQALRFDSLSTPYVIVQEESFIDSSSIGFAFWIKANGSEQPEAFTRFFDTRLDNIGIAIQQRVDSTLEIRIDTKNGEFNSIFGKSDILNNQWHHYAFTLERDHLRVWSDGTLITDTLILFGDGFTNSTHPTLGSNPILRGTIDEAMLFDGSPSSAWIQLNYLLQAHANSWTMVP